jgi:integrase/recombinase XerC
MGDPNPPSELAGLADRYLTERVRHGTLNPLTARNYRSSLTGLAAAFGDRPAGELTTEHLEGWLASRTGLSAATRRGDLTAAIGFCAWLRRHGHVEVDPSLDVPRIRQPDPMPRALDAEAVAAVLRVCPDSRARAIVWLQVGLGLRCGEVSRLRVADWTRSSETLRVRGKGGRQRELPVTRAVATAVAGYLAEHPAPPWPAAFLVRSYRRPWASLAPDTISGLVSEWMRAAGIKAWPRDGVSAHALRHTCATDVLVRSKDLQAVSEMLGHRQLQTTAIYLKHANLSRLREAMEDRDYGPPLRAVPDREGS